MREVVVLLEAPLTAADAVRVVEAAGPGPVRLHVLLPMEDMARRLEVGLGTPGEASWASPLYLPEGGVERLHAESEAASVRALRASLAALTEAGASAVSGGVVDEDPIDVLAHEVADRGSAAVLLVTRPHPATHLLRVDWAHRAVRRLDVPVTHLLAGRE